MLFGILCYCVMMSACWYFDILFLLICDFGSVLLLQHFLLIHDFGSVLVFGCFLLVHDFGSVLVLIFFG